MFKYVINIRIYYYEYYIQLFNTYKNIEYNIPNNINILEY
jgi:hypothetical protein